MNLEPWRGGLRPTTGTSYAGVGSLRSGTEPLPNVRGYDVVTQENAGADAVLGAAAGLAGGAIAGAVGAFKAASSVLDRMSMGPSNQQFHVEKDTVLKAGTVIHDQWKLLEDAYTTLAPALLISTAGGVVTSDVVEAWNDRLVNHGDSYANRILRYMQVLESLSNQLKSSAQQYGFTDDEISSAFKPKE